MQKVSEIRYVLSDRPLDFDYMGLFNPTEEISYLYCEGFHIFTVRDFQKKKFTDVMNRTIQCLQLSFVLIIICTLSFSYLRTT